MAALLASAFVLFALLGRVFIQYWQTGNHGIRLANPRTEPTASIAGAVFSGSFAVSLSVVALDYFGFWPVKGWAVPCLNEAALLIGLIGVGIVVNAQLQMGRAWRIGVDPAEQTQLITHGLYKKSRNPIYFGIALYWLGLAVLLPHPLMWLLGISCWASIEVIVRRVEEPYLQKLHGQQFIEYKAHTKRYLPL